MCKHLDLQRRVTNALSVGQWHGLFLLLKIAMRQQCHQIISMPTNDYNAKFSCITLLISGLAGFGVTGAWFMPYSGWLKWLISEQDYGFSAGISSLKWHKA